MENIKIFITPEATNAFSEISAVKDEYEKSAIKGLYAIMKSGSSSEYKVLQES